MIVPLEEPQFSTKVIYASTLHTLYFAIHSSSIFMQLSATF